MNGISADEFYNFVSSQNPRSMKYIHDNVHGNIYIDQLSLNFIDTEEFQRLRDLKQLGITHMVYPGATHSRFEHSLGVYWLADKAVQEIYAHRGKVEMDRSDIQTVRLAGLLHDVGHGPFSHLFEREFIPRILNYGWSHEEMSLQMIDHIVDKHNIDIHPDRLKEVKDMIFAGSEISTPTDSKEKRFLYDIVANGRNGIDVDKFDYIIRDSRACGLGCNFHFERLMETMRVIENEICYRAKDYLTIHKLFASRADLYRTVYMHTKVKAIDLMLVDALVEANDFLKISSYLHDPSSYSKLDDSIIKTIENSLDQELKKSRDLILRIRRRDLYQFCNEFSVPKYQLDHFRDVTAQDIICSQQGGISIHEDDIIVNNIKIDLTRGKLNPLHRINFYEDYDSENKFPIDDDRISHLLPTCFQDMLVRVYSKKPELVGAVSKAFENFQEKKYGGKAQVHPTPEKKKRRM